MPSPKVSYLPNGKVYEVQTWYTDGARRPESPTSTMTLKSKVKVAMSRDASDRSRTISREQKVPINTKIGRSTVAHHDQ